MCKYDEARCESWAEEKKVKAKAVEEDEKKKKAALADKGTDKDPEAIKGPGGAIPKTLEEIKAEKEAEEDAKEEEAKASKDKVKSCDKCRAADLKKEKAIPKAVSERYDQRFKAPRDVNPNTHQIPNPTVTKSEKKLVNEALDKHGYEHDDKIWFRTHEQHEHELKMLDKETEKEKKTQNPLGSQKAP